MHCCPAGCYGQDPSQSGCVKVEQIDDKAEFADLDAAILQCIPEGGAEKKGTLFQIERVMVTMGETIIGHHGLRPRSFAGTPGSRRCTPASS